MIPEKNKNYVSVPTVEEVEEDKVFENEEKTNDDTDNQNDFSEEQPKIISKGFGVRHTQMVIVFFCLTISYAMRSHMSVTMVAMTSCPQNHTDTTMSMNYQNSSIQLNTSMTIEHMNLTILSERNKKKSSFYCVTDNDEDVRKNWSVFQTYKWRKSIQEVIIYAFFLGYTMMTIFGGMVAQKYGGKIPILVTLFSNSIICILTPWVPIFTGWVGIAVFRFIQGLTQAALYPSVHTLLAQWAPLSERGRFSSYVYSGCALGTIFAFQVSGFIGGNMSLGWPVTYWFLGTLSMIAFCLLLRCGKASPLLHKSITQEELQFITGTSGADHGKKLPVPWRKVFKSIPVLAILVAHAGSNVGFLFVLNEIPVYMNKVLDVDIKRSGLYSSLPYIAMYTLTVAFGYLTDHYKKKGFTILTIRRVMNTIGTMLPGLFLIGYMMTNTVWIAVVLMIISQGLHGGIYVGFHINYIDIAPNFAGTMMAIGNMFANLVGLLGPFIVSTVLNEDDKNHKKWQLLAIIMSSILIFSNLVFVIFAKGDVQSWAKADDHKEGNERKYSYMAKRKDSDAVPLTILKQTNIN